jgi:hypothetical protein
MPVGANSHHKGHKSVESTGIYTHTTEIRRKNAVLRLRGEEVA